MDEPLLYTEFRLEKAGAARGRFTEEAVRRIHHQALAIPRSIKILCDLCSLEGCKAKASSADEGIAGRAALGNV